MHHADARAAVATDDGIVVVEPTIAWIGGLRLVDVDVETVADAGTDGRHGDVGRITSRIPRGFIPPHGCAARAECGGMSAGPVETLAEFAGHPVLAPLRRRTADRPTAMEASTKRMRYIGKFRFRGICSCTQKEGRLRHVRMMVGWRTGAQFI